MTFVQFVALVLAICVPWITGTVLLIWLESSGRHTLEINWPRQLGYGYFLGLLVCSILLRIVFSLGSLPPYPATSIALLLICSSGLWLSFRNARPRTPVGRSALGQSQVKGMGLVTALLFALILLHLIPMLMVLLERPVFGWDAWSTWVYRSKLWFLTGDLVPLVAPRDWLASPAADAYTINAWHYPKFVSLVYLWIALALGAWNESLISLPSFLAGLAIAMALYGQARDCGIGLTASLIMIYLFLSMPLMNAHMTLGGYADIWMAGFAGLGFVSLIRSLLDRSTRQTVTGLLFLAASAFVKNEGLVWVVTGLVFLTVCQLHMRNIVIGLIVCGGCAGIVLAIYGSSYVDIPGLGRIGYAEGQILLANLGSYRLAFKNVSGEFLTNFFIYSNWSLLWFIVVLSLVTAIAGIRKLVNRTNLTFIFTICASLFLIFFLSGQAEWAKDYTAINRLPLQVLPAILFACLIIWHNAYTENQMVVPE